MFLKMMLNEYPQSFRDEVIYYGGEFITREMFMADQQNMGTPRRIIESDLGDIPALNKRRLKKVKDRAYDVLVTTRGFRQADQFTSNQGINRQNVRAYHLDGDDNAVELHKNLDGSPPFYTLYHRNSPTGIPRIVRLFNKNEWGDGLSWEDAEKKAALALQNQLFRE